MRLGPDVGDLLRSARARARLSQRQLAVASGLSRSALLSYESGRTAPSTALLDRLLAACGLQLGITLEPRVEPLDALVARVRGGVPAVPVDRLRTLGERFQAAGVRWAVDGATALAALGIAVPADDPAVVVQDAPALRAFLTHWLVRGYDVEADRSLGEQWSELTTEEVDRFLPPGTLVSGGPLEVRVVPALPPVLEVSVDDEGERVVLPVLSERDVEAAHPGLAELLGALRDYRAEHG